MNFIKKKLRGLLNKINYDVFPKGNGITIAEGFSIGKYFNINISNANICLNIGKNVIIKEFCSILMFPNSNLIIGEGVFFNNYCSINCLQKIEIGKNTLFGEGVKIYDHNHLYEKEPINVYAHQFTMDSVIIGEKCWIGSNVTILKGVTIGNNVIVGANSLVYKSIPDNTIIKSDITFSQLK